MWGADAVEQVVNGTDPSQQGWTVLFEHDDAGFEDLRCASAALDGRFDSPQVGRGSRVGAGQRKIGYRRTRRADAAQRSSRRDGRPPNSGPLFAQLAGTTRVIVLNDPSHLTDASNKTCFQHFPEEVRPGTCITRDPDEIKVFIASQDGAAVIKPLQGSGGQSVFVVTPDSAANLNQMIEAVTRDGYAIVQEYLPKAAEGDLRLLTLNGRPLQVDGQYACFRRYNDSGDARSNITAGGKIEMMAPDADALRLAEIVAPKLIRDGMCLAGPDHRRRQDDGDQRLRAGWHQHGRGTHRRGFQRPHRVRPGAESTTALALPRHPDQLRPDHDARLGKTRSAKEVESWKSAVS